MIIKIYTKEVYGKTFIYAENYQKELKELTGKKTLDAKNIKALQCLGITFEWRISSQDAI